MHQLNRKKIILFIEKSLLKYTHMRVWISKENEKVAQNLMSKIFFLDSRLFYRQKRV
jgi:hypothetical protein